MDELISLFSEHKFLFRSLCTLHLNGGKCNALRSRMTLVLYFNLLALSMYLYMLGVLFPMCRCNAFASNLICQFVHSFVIKPLLTHTKYSFDTSSCYHSVLIIFRPDAQLKQQLMLYRSRLIYIGMLCFSIIPLKQLCSSKKSK